MLEDTRLKIFMAVATRRSFTEAARSLDITQPAVSQCIADLEKQTGAQLFIRNRGDVSLTPQGETFKIFASRIIKNYEDLNAVFADYEAFEKVSGQVNELIGNPLFPMFKDKLL